MKLTPDRRRSIRSATFGPRWWRNRTSWWRHWCTSSHRSAGQAKPWSRRPWNPKRGRPCCWWIRTESNLLLRRSGSFPLLWLCKAMLRTRQARHCNHSKIFKKCDHLSFVPITIQMRSEVNFTNVLQAAFTQEDPKSAKRQSSRQCLFVLLGSLRAKAACKMLVKSNQSTISISCSESLVPVISLQKLKLTINLIIHLNCKTGHHKLR